MQFNQVSSAMLVKYGISDEEKSVVAPLWPAFYEKKKLLLTDALIADIGYSRMHTIDRLILQAPYAAGRDYDIVDCANEQVQLELEQTDQAEDRISPNKRFVLISPDMLINLYTLSKYAVGRQRAGLLGRLASLAQEIQLREELKREHNEIILLATSDASVQLDFTGIPTQLLVKYNFSEEENRMAGFLWSDLYRKHKILLKDTMIAEIYLENPEKYTSNDIGNFIDRVLTQDPYKAGVDYEIVKYDHPTVWEQLKVDHSNLSDRQLNAMYNRKRFILVTPDTLNLLYLSARSSRGHKMRVLFNKIFNLVGDVRNYLVVVRCQQAKQLAIEAAEKINQEKQLAIEAAKAETDKIKQESEVQLKKATKAVARCVKAAKAAAEKSTQDARRQLEAEFAEREAQRIEQARLAREALDAERREVFKALYDNKQLKPKNCKVYVGASRISHKKGIYKLGITSTTLEDRLNTYNTGKSGDELFCMLRSWDCTYHKSLEKTIFDALQYWRVESDTPGARSNKPGESRSETIKIPLDQLYEIVSDIINGVEGPIERIRERVQNSALSEAAERHFRAVEADPTLSDFIPLTDIRHVTHVTTDPCKEKLFSKPEDEQKTILKQAVQEHIRRTQQLPNYTISDTSAEKTHTIKWPEIYQTLCEIYDIQGALRQLKSKLTNLLQATDIKFDAKGKAT